MAPLQDIQEVSPPGILSVRDSLQSMLQRPVMLCEKAQVGLNPAFDI